MDRSRKPSLASVAAKTKAKFKAKAKAKAPMSARRPPPKKRKPPPKRRRGDSASRRDGIRMNKPVLTTETASRVDGLLGCVAKRCVC